MIYVPIAAGLEEWRHSVAKPDSEQARAARELD